MKESTSSDPEPQITHVQECDGGKIQVSLLIYPDRGRFASQDATRCHIDVRQGGDTILRVGGAKLSTTFLAAGHALKERGL